MGNLCCRRRKERRKIVLLLLGLDNAGKTVAAKHLAGEDINGVMPTIGFSTVKLKYSRYDVSIFDLGGRPDFREVWPRYFVDAYGVIFVIDSSDNARLDESKQVLESIATNVHIRGKPILLLANKQDNDNALDDIDLIERFDLDALANNNQCPTLVQTCSCAKKQRKVDPGVKIGFTWIMNCIRNEYAQLEARVHADMELQERIDEVERREKIERLHQLNELEKMRVEEDSSRLQLVASPVRNGAVSKVFSGDTLEDLKDLAAEIESNSSNMSSEEPERPIYFVPPSNVFHPRSATNLIRQHLELESIQRRSSLHFGANKTAPLQLCGGNSRAQSAKVSYRKKGEESVALKLPDRRNLHSAGDSVFIVSGFTSGRRSAQRQITPNQHGAGDLVVYPTLDKKVKSDTLKQILPPVNCTHSPILINDHNYF